MYKVLRTLLLLLPLVVLSGCRADVELDKIDPTVSLDMGIGMPIGTIAMTTNDLLGFIQSENRLFVDENGVVFYRDTFHISRSFRNINISAYFAEGEKSIKMHELLPGATTLMLPFPMETTMKMPISFRFDMFNNTELERIDSIDILHTQLQATLYKTDMEAFSWDWVKSISLVLGDQFTRKEGDTICVYDKAEGRIQHFGEQMVVDVDNFTASFIKDRTKAPSINNSVDSVGLEVLIDLSIPAGQAVSLSSNSGFRLTYHFTLSDYNAIWGRFIPSSDMADAATIDLDSVWGGWSDLRKMKLPLADPQVKLDVTTKIAGNLDVNGSYIYVTNDEHPNDTVFALFDGQKGHHYIFDSPSTTIDIDRSTIGQSVTNQIYFDKNESRGAIDRLFLANPDHIGYKFAVNMYQPERAPYQVRLTHDNDIHIRSIITMPFRFNKDLYVLKTDTLKYIELSAGLLDSLNHIGNESAGVEIKSLKLVLNVANTIPVDMHLNMRFVDENFQPITYLDQEGKEKELDMPALRDMTISAPTFQRVAGHTVAEATVSNIVLPINEDELKAFAQVKSIIYEVSASDESLRGNTLPDVYPITITSDQTVEIHIGLATSGTLHGTLTNVSK